MIRIYGFITSMLQDVTDLCFGVPEGTDQYPGLSTQAQTRLNALVNNDDC